MVEVRGVYGLPSDHWKAIYRIIHAQRTRLRWVKLFGSRARREARATSDVDLAFAGEPEVCGSLCDAFERSGLPYTFDLVDYERQSNERLRQAIDAEGRLLLEIGEDGDCLMTEEQIRLKWEDYHRALRRLQAALRKEPDEDDLYLDATIQRFEFCFELAWKLMKAVLSYEGIEVSSPRASIREGWKQGLVQEAEAWLDMLEKRNLSAHTYNEQTAQVIYAAVKGKYFAMLAAFDEDVAARLGEDER